MKSLSLLYSSIGSSKCWFCEQESADPKCSVQITMTKILHVEEHSYKRRTVTSTNRKIFIPRCRTCYKNKKLIDKLFWITTFSLIPMIGVGFGMNALVSNRLPWFIFPFMGGFIWFIFAYFIIRKKLKPKLDHKKSIKEHPSYKALYEAGYRWGIQMEAGL